MIAYITHKKDKPRVEIYDNCKHISVQCSDEDKAHELLNTLQFASDEVQISM
jgi:hypothetical protein